MYGRRILWLFVYISFAICFCFAGIAHGAEQPEIKAESAVLMDVKSGRVLYAKDAHQRLPQASTTKITSAILALEMGDLQDRITVSKKAAETGGSAIWLEEGEVLTLEELLYAMLLSSANDAAAAVAEYIGGTQEDFVKLMNERAAELGAQKTHYENPHGLDDDNHYSSAYDLAVLGRHAMQLPRFREIVNTRKKVIPWAGHEWSRLLLNKNKLVWNRDLYPGANGIKNGFTTPAGNCLVASAERSGLELVAVVLDAPNATDEVIKLFDYGFANFSEIRLASRGDVVSSLRVAGSKRIDLVAADDFYAAARPGEEDHILPVVSAPKNINVGVKRGEIIGRILYQLNGEIIGSVNLVAAETVEVETWLGGIWHTFLDIFSLLA